jgi:hypothetical protein
VADGFTVVLSVVIAIALFMVLPLFIADIMARYVPWVTTAHVPVIEGVVKIALFILYILLISLMDDIKRTFMYHGAEHKCINCIENGRVLNVENVRKSSRYHKRCGTSFLLIVLIISIIMFMLIRTDIVWIKYLIRVLLVPVIAGISYEFIKKAGSSDSKIMNILSMPGMWMQKITTKEPTDDMIEVAIQAVEAVFDWEQYLENNGIDVNSTVSKKSKAGKTEATDDWRKNSYLWRQPEQTGWQQGDNKSLNRNPNNSWNYDSTNISNRNYNTKQNSQNTGSWNNQETNGDTKERTGSGYNWKY